MDSPFDQLSHSDAFEELVFDLLRAEGFRDLIWRGPGADGGRDIEASWDTRDPLGGVLRTTWYIECKWYSESVPFAEIETKLLAATAARADFLLVVTSTRVKNTAMDAVQRWLSTRGHPFRVRYLGGHDVLRLAVKHADVFAKHFPASAPPPWSNGEADAARLRALAATSADRLSWRLVPAIQWLYGTTGNASEPAVITQELDLVSCMLRAHQLFASLAMTPSTRRIALADALELAVVCAQRREPKVEVTKQVTDCEIRTSRPLLVAAAYELCLNAVQYTEDGKAAVAVTVEQHHVVIEIRNSSHAAIPPDWPQVGLRAHGGRNRSAAAQGLGCWLADQACNTVGWRVWWTVDGGSWIARMQGPRE